jgi:hypothetical protein
MFYRNKRSWWPIKRKRRTEFSAREGAKSLLKFQVWKKNSLLGYSLLFLLGNVIGFYTAYSVTSDKMAPLLERWFFFVMFLAFNPLILYKLLSEYQGTLELLPERIVIKRFFLTFSLTWGEIEVIECDPDPLSKAPSKLLLLFPEGWITLSSKLPYFAMLRSLILERTKSHHCLQQGDNFVQRVQDTLAKQKYRLWRNRLANISASIFPYLIISLLVVLALIVNITNNVSYVDIFFNTFFAVMITYYIISLFKSLFGLVATYPDNLAELLGYERLSIATVARRLLDFQQYLKGKQSFSTWRETKEKTVEAQAICKILLLQLLAQGADNDEAPVGAPGLNVQDHQVLQKLLVEIGDKDFLTALLRAIEPVATAEYLPVLQRVIAGKTAAGEDEVISSAARKCLAAVERRTRSVALLRANRSEEEHLLRASSIISTPSEQLLRGSVEETVLEEDKSKGILGYRKEISLPQSPLNSVESQGGDNTC